MTVLQERMKAGESVDNFFQKKLGNHVSLISDPDYENQVSY